MTATSTSRRPASALTELFSEGIDIQATVPDTFAEIVTPDAMRFVAGLQRAFDTRRQGLLARRQERQARFDAGELPDFLPETAAIRVGDWRVAPLPSDLLDRRVEITGPVDRKMVINALNSGANCFMADFEDSHSPTWDATIQGQINLRDAIAGTIDYVHPETSKRYELNSQVATLIVRPRGWHLVERHVLVDGQPMSASLWDFGLYLFHNAKQLLREGAGPISICPSWKATSKPGSGMMSSSRPRRTWGYRREPSEPRY